MKLFSFGFLAISFLFATAQEEIITYGEASQLPTSINSTQDDIMPLVSSDGQTLFFVRDGGEETKTGQNIFRSTKTENDWGEATIKTSHLNNKQNNAVVGISKDGNTIYLVDAYRKYNDANQGIAISKLDGKKWSKPEYIEISGMNYLANHFYGFYVNPEETVMLLSMVSENGKGKEDLHISLKEGDSCWSTPKSLGENVNSEGYEMSPFLALDNNRIYFSSNGFGGEGDADVFYIDKLGDDWFTWSNPINLGANVNSAGFDAYFSIGEDNLAYFSSNRNDGQNDIFTTQITIEIIGEEPAVEEPLAEVPLAVEVVVEETIVEVPVVVELAVEEALVEVPAGVEADIYTVQVAAYKNASNYDASHLASFGKIEKVILDDGITRFTLGEFKTLKEAIQHKEQVRSKGQPDAFVIMYSEGKRTYPELDNESSIH